MGENQQQTQLTYDTKSRNRTRVTVVRGKRSNPYATHASHNSYKICSYIDDTVVTSEQCSDMSLTKYSAKLNMCDHFCQMYTFQHETDYLAPYFWTKLTVPEVPCWNNVYVWQPKYCAKSMKIH
jgi:hypothetical protein